MIARLFRSGVCMLLVSAINTVARAEVATVIDEEGSSSYDQSLFHHVNSIEVLGPSSFPRPTEIAKTDAHDVVEPYLKPVIGKHRPDQDAVFAYAAEYPLENYMAFIASLRETGFKGDIVLGVSSLDLKKDEIRRYLSTPNIIVYKADVICRNLEGDTVDSAKGGSRGCQFNDVYARQRKGATGENEDLLTGIPDPRPSRTLQIMRYEIYWIMAQNYNPDAWIFLVDARDTVFQSDPFADVPRKTDPSLKSGLLYFFGESTEATRLGRSKFNRKWLTNAYGGVVATALAEKPTICSGTTMGEQVALDSYLRAMVTEGDDTGVVLVGADQGFHNFLYYSHKLKNDLKIHDIVVFDQGEGIVNNLGALRTKSLGAWGNGKIVRKEKMHNGKPKYTVLNWDGTPSPVVHQYDRHSELSIYFVKDKNKIYWEQWQEEKKHLRNASDK